MKTDDVSRFIQQAHSAALSLLVLRPGDILLGVGVPGARYIQLFAVTRVFFEATARCHSRSHDTYSTYLQHLTSRFKMARRLYPLQAVRMIRRSSIIPTLEHSIPPQKTRRNNIPHVATRPTRNAITEHPLIDRRLFRARVCLVATWLGGIAFRREERGAEVFKRQEGREGKVMAVVGCIGHISTEHS
jgi:hypothetical protein